MTVPNRPADGEFTRMSVVIGDASAALSGFAKTTLCAKQNSPRMRVERERNEPHGVIPPWARLCGRKLRVQSLETAPMTAQAILNRRPRRTNSADLAQGL